MTNASEQKLSPCPFCGSTNEDAVYNYDPTYGSWRVRCLSCGTIALLAERKNVVSAHAHPPEIERLIEAAISVCPIRPNVTRDDADHTALMRALDAVRPGWREKM